MVADGSDSASDVIQPLPWAASEGVSISSFALPTAAIANGRVQYTDFHAIEDRKWQHSLWFSRQKTRCAIFCL